jgi:WD40 repeat protein
VKISKTQFASGSLDGAIVIWHADTLKPARILAFPNVYRSEIDHQYLFNVRSLELLNQRYLIVAVGNGFGIFDLYTGEKILEKKDAHDAACTKVLPLYRGKKIVSCSDDGTIRLWGPAQEFDLLLKQSGSTGTGGSHNQAGNTSANGLITSPADLDTSPMVDPSQKEGTSFRNLFSSKKKNKINSPILIGEMNVHSGAVNSIMAINQTNFVSVGSDALVVVWKGLFASLVLFLFFYYLFLFILN